MSLWPRLIFLPGTSEWQAFHLGMKHSPLFHSSEPPSNRTWTPTRTQRAAWLHVPTMRPHKNSQLSRTGRSLLKRLSMQLFYPAVIRIVGSTAWCLQWFSYRGNVKSYKLHRHFEREEIFLKWTQTDFTYCTLCNNYFDYSHSWLANCALFTFRIQVIKWNVVVGVAPTPSRSVNLLSLSAASSSCLVLKVRVGATFCSCSDTGMLWRRLRFHLKV